MRRYSLLIFTICTTFLVLAGCATKAPPGTAAYQEGWKYGCWAGHDMGADPEWTAELATPPRFGNDPDFARGQSEGYTQCWDRALARPTGGR